MTDSDDCADQVRQHDHDRFLTAQFAAADRRSDLLALYAFNVEVARTREVVSEPMLGQIRLQWWRDTLEILYSGERRHHAVADALGQAIVRRDLPRGLFDGILEAREFDLDDHPPRTLGELKTYAEQTSSNLTLLALQVLGFVGGPEHLAGRHVGLAWALTGLLRAVPFHARQRRLYLPDDLMERAGLDGNDVFEAREGTSLGPVVERIVAAAREHLAHARDQKAVARAALAALVPATLADDYLARIARADHDLWRPSIYGGRLRRLTTLWWRTRRGRF